MTQRKRYVFKIALNKAEQHDSRGIWLLALKFVSYLESTFEAEVYPRRGSPGAQQCRDVPSAPAAERGPEAVLGVSKNRRFMRHLLSLHLPAVKSVHLYLSFQTYNQELTPLMHLLNFFLFKQTITTKTNKQTTIKTTKNKQTKNTPKKQPNQKLFQVLSKISSNVMSRRHFSFPEIPKKMS